MVSFQKSGAPSQRPGCSPLTWTVWRSGIPLYTEMGGPAWRPTVLLLLLLLGAVVVVVIFVAPGLLSGGGVWICSFSMMDHAGSPGNDS